MEAGQRRLEYTRRMNSPHHSQYRAEFADVIVPAVEHYLEASFDRDDRRLVGFSDGAEWVYDYFSDYPDFARYAIALSPGGGIPDDVAPCSLNSCGMIFTGAGLQEEGFLQNARGVENVLSKAEWNVSFLERNSGHSPATWGPMFI